MCRRIYSLVLAALAVGALFVHAGGNGSGNITYPGVAKGEHFLAAGPLSVTLSRYTASSGKTVKTEASLLLLTQETILYQEKDSSGGLKAPTRESASKSDTLLSIQSNDSAIQQTWKRDKKTKLFTGEVVKPAEIKIVADSFASVEEAKYLFFLYLQMQVALDSALKTNNGTQIKAMLDKADRFAKVAEQNAAGGDVAALFRKMKSHHDELKQIAQEREGILKQLQEKNKEYAQERGKIESARQARFNIGAGGLLLGVSTDDPELAAQAYVGMSKAAANYAADRNRLELARKYAEGAMLIDLNGVANKQDAAWEARDKLVQSVEQRLKLPERESVEAFAKQMETGKDLAAAIRKLDSLAASYRQATKHGNPWLQDEIYYLTSLLPHAATQKQKTIDLLFDLANKTLAEAKHIPSGPAHDVDRAVMVWRAAELALKAADLAYGEEKSLRGAYSQKAVFALRLLETTKKYDLIDIGADVREVEMVGMALCGMHDEALDLGAKVAEARPNSPLVHLYMAKLYASSGDKKTGIPAAREELAKAIKAGYSDFPAAKKNADLKKVIDDRFVYENMTAVITYKLVTVQRRPDGKGGFIPGGVEAQFTNTSPFAVKGVDIALVGNGFGYAIGKQYDLLKIEVLAPQQTRMWMNPGSVTNEVNFRSLAFFPLRKDVRVEKAN